MRETMPPRKLVAAWADNQPIVDALCKALEGDCLRASRTYNLDPRRVAL